MEVPEEKVVEIEEKIPAEPVTEEDVRSELYEEVSEKTDIDIAKEENQKAQTYLKMAEKEFGQNDIRLRKQKILVAALVEYRMKWYNEDEATAKSKIPEQNQVME